MHRELGRTRCARCGAMLPEELDTARFCPNCGEDPYLFKSEAEALSEQTGESVARIVTKEDEEADKGATREHIDDFKKKMGWNKNDAA